MSTSPVQIEITGARARILVVDDNASLTRAIKRGLRDYDVEVENDPAHAVERVTSGEIFDLILCDCRMPGMRGFEVLGAIRAHFICDDGPLLVAMSGDANAQDWGDLGGAVLLVKPFHPSAIRALLDDGPAPKRR